MAAYVTRLDEDGKSKTKGVQLYMSRQSDSEEDTKSTETAAIAICGDLNAHWPSIIIRQHARATETARMLRYHYCVENSGATLVAGNRVSLKPPRNKPPHGPRSDLKKDSSSRCTIHIANSALYLVMEGL